MEYYFPTPDESAGFISRLLSRQAGNKNPFKVLLSGGRSIVPVVEAFRNIEVTLLSRCRFFLADERVGGDYNQQMLKERLFDDLIGSGAITEDQLVFPDISKPPRAMALDYAGRLPGLDIAFLGVGEDGHVASLFPNHPALFSTGTVEVVADSPRPPPERITVTYRAFSRSTAVVLMFFGAGKRSAFKRFKTDDNYRTCPAVYFKGGKNLYILHDQESGL